ncbi:MBL fold metallo-hydrolase [Chloroflexota bacterium]
MAAVIIRFLGTHNAESRDSRLASLLIDDVLAVDAGSLASELSLAEQDKIKAVLLSHGHYDHIRGIPALAFNNSHRTIRVLATPETLEVLTSHLVDGVIYPKFTEKLPFLEKVVLKTCPLKPYEPVEVEGYRVLALPANHPVGAVGYEIADGDGRRVFYTGDTGPGLAPLWEHVQPDLLIMDTTFPNSYAVAARDSGHLCPRMLGEELAGFRRLKGYLPRVVLVHLSPKFEAEIGREVDKVARELGITIGIAGEGEQLTI